MHTIIALSSALITAAYFVYISHIMKTRARIASTLVLAASHLVGAGMLVVAWLLFSRDMPFIFASTKDAGLLVATALLLVLSRELYFYSYSRTDVANVTVFSALTPVYTLLAGFVLLGEVPSLAAAAGLFLICASIYGLFLRIAPDASLARNLTQPFRAMTHSTPIFCAFLSTIPTVFAAIFQKTLMENMNPITFSLGLLLIIGVVALGISRFLFSGTELRTQLRQLPPGFFIASATLLPLMHVLFCLVIREHLAAAALVLQRFSIVFQIALAYYFLRERQFFGKRIIAGLLIMLGFALVISGS